MGCGEPRRDPLRERQVWIEELGLVSGGGGGGAANEWSLPVGFGDLPGLGVSA